MCVLLCHIRLVRLSFVRITFLVENHTKALTFKGTSYGSSGGIRLSWKLDELVEAFNGKNLPRYITSPEIFSPQIFVF